jgi:hypothetical protein
VIKIYHNKFIFKGIYKYTKKQKMNKTNLIEVTPIFI